ncbi:MAG: thymidine phosphorylase [Actinobacteria bacterium]|nr:thymidine phosphorylase [Actinomycetota bacterium]
MCSPPARGWGGCWSPVCRAPWRPAGRTCPTEPEGEDVDFAHDVIAWKRDGNELDEPRMHAFVQGVVSGAVPSYQASALLMAMVLRGLSDGETLLLARALVDSGKTLDLRVLRRPVLDKHSSGGVGDKVTLVLAPLVAACGAVVGKMSGRGLGHTGGTLDKLESIPGFRVKLPQGDFLRQLERIGVAVVSQSERVVPADRLLYALRDVTGTVECDGVIAASIMAKKVASGTSAVVLDLKVGRGAFAADLEHAREIGRLCRLIGDDYGRPTTCLFSAMDQPLGRTVGNRLEVEEAWQVLRGDGPEDVRDLTLELAAELLPLADLGMDAAEARARAEAALADGRAAEHFERWCYVQGGDWRPGEFQRLAGHEVTSPRAGYVTAVDALAVGRAAQTAGAGRRTVEDKIDASAGVLLEHKVGDQVEAGEPLAAVFSRDPARRRQASTVLETAFTVGPEAPPPAPLVLGRE